MLLSLPDPYDFALSTERFRVFGIDRANLWHEGGLHRAVGGREVRIEAAPGGVDVEPLDDETLPVVLHLLGAPFDLAAFTAWAAEQPPLAALTARLAGFRPPLQPDPWEALVTSITAQQVSLFSAVAIRNRLIERFGAPVGLAWAFPTRERIAAADESELVGVGFTRRKAEYAVALARSSVDLHALAARLAGFRPPLQPDPWEALVTSITAQQVSLFSAVAIRNRLIERFGEPVGLAWAFPTRERIAAADESELVGVGFTRRKAEYAVALARADLDLRALAELDDDEVRATITAQRGLGPWTAEWFLARHLARPRAWPTGDLALRKAALLLYGVDVDALGPLLDPFQNLSAHYLLTGARTP